MSTPLTDRINSLISQANEATGASDTTLSDAVETLVEGFGAVEGENESNFEDFSGGNITAIITHSNGGQNGSWINTRYLPHGNANIYCKIAITEEQEETWANIFAAFFSNGRIGCQINNTTNNKLFVFISATTSVDANVEYSEEATVLRISSPYLLPTDIAIKPLVIANGYYGSNGNYDRCASMIFYGLKVYENGKLTKKYVPWLDDNNIPCVRELVDDEYFYNAGVNNFGYIDLNGNIIEE